MKRTGAKPNVAFGIWLLEQAKGPVPDLYISNGLFDA
jgi:hypothetical protein